MGDVLFFTPHPGTRCEGTMNPTPNKQKTHEKIPETDGLDQIPQICTSIPI